MRAAVLHTHGQPPGFGEHPDAVAGEGRALVRIAAAPIVQLDVLIASGRSYFGAPPVPYVPGDQGVGVVVSSGALAAGTRVFVETRAGRLPVDGSMAELCAVPEDDVVPIRDDVPDTLAAAIGLQGVAAWRALMRRAELRARETVLVLGGGGAVGQAGVGVARAAGAGRVVAACRTEAAAQRARAAGAEEVVLLTGDGSGTVEELAARFEKACGGAVDVVLDPVFGLPATAAARVLAPGARLVNLGGLAGDSATFSSAALRSRTAAVLGYTNAALTAAERSEALDAVLALAAAGQVTVAAEEVPLTDAAAAWQRTASGGAGVRIVLQP